MTNAERIIKNGYKFYDLDCDWNGKNGHDIFIKNNCIGMIKGDNSPLGAVLKWLDMEYEYPILNDSEKKYLSDVIRPFRGEIRSIQKHRNLSKTLDRIYFHMKNGDMFYLSNFKAETMYKGMELDKQYTLEELGL